MIEYALKTAKLEVNEKPRTYSKAFNSDEKDKWIEAMDEEIDSLEKNQTWELVHRLEGKKLVGCKWIYKKNEGISS